MGSVGEQQGPAPEGARLGKVVYREGALAEDGGTAIWPFDAMPGHCLILGAPDTGKTETALRIACEAAVGRSASVFYLKCGVDPDAADRFGRAMKQVGREVRMFPDEPMDLWRGDSQQVLRRLEHLLPAQDPALHGAERVALGIAVRQPAGPPRSSRELLDRLHERSLFDRQEGGDLLLTAAKRVAMHFQVFFDGSPSYDGDWSWEDADAAFVDLHDLSLGPVTERGTIIEYFFFCLHQYLAQLKDADRLCVIVVEGLPPTTELTKTMRVARPRDTTILVSVPASEAQGTELLLAAETVFLHRLAWPSEASELLPSSRHAEEALSLPDGTVLVTRNGKIDKVQIRPLAETAVSP